MDAKNQQDEIDIIINNWAREKLKTYSSDGADRACMRADLVIFKRNLLDGLKNIAEIKAEDYNELGDTFIDAKRDAPFTQWRIIAGILSANGLKVVKK